MEEKEINEIKMVLRHCLGILDIDGTNTKAKVKKELKRILEVYFEEEKETEKN